MKNNTLNLCKLDTLANEWNPPVLLPVHDERQPGPEHCHCVKESRMGSNNKHRGFRLRDLDTKSLETRDFRECEGQT